MPEGWRVSRGGGSCCRCHESFSEGQLLFSCLVERGAELVRLDFCTDCWDDRLASLPAPAPPAAGANAPGEAAAPSAEEVFCFWRTRRPASKARPKVNTQLMLEFFDRLQHQADGAKRTLRFVLALYLMRRKELKMLGVSRREDAESLLLERRSSGEKVEVENPGLTEQQVQDTAVRLGELLDASL